MYRRGAMSGAVAHYRQSSGIRGFITVAFLVVVFSALIPYAARAADFELHPSITVREEYNDNIFLTKSDKVHDFITRAYPSIDLTYKAPIWTWDLWYAFDYVYYARNKHDAEYINHLNARGLIEILENDLFLRLADEFGRQSLDITRDYTKESTFVNQSNRNVFTVNPYYIFHFSSALKLTTGYTYTNTWYKDPSAVNKQDHVFSAESIYDLSPRITLTSGYRFTHENNDESNFNRNDVYVGPRYEYAEKSFVYGTIGNSWLNYKDGDNTSNVYWSAGITHTFPTFVAFLESGVSYDEDPLGTIRLTRRYLGGVRYDRERIASILSLGLTSYRSESRTADIDEGDTDKYAITGSVKYTLTPRLTGTLDLSLEKLDRKDVDGYTRRFLSGLRFDYLVFEETALALGYYYSDNTSPSEALAGEVYANNRVFIEISKRF